MVFTKSKVKSIIINGIEIPVDDYYSLLKFVLDSLKDNNTKDYIKNSLVNVGWDIRIIDYILEVDQYFVSGKKLEKSNIITNITSNQKEDSSKNQSYSKEEIDKLEESLKFAMKDFNKFEGKLESEDSSIVKFDEKISVMKDTISEVRGMVISTEKRISEFEHDLEKANTIISDYDPQVLDKRFIKLEKDMNLQESELMRSEEKFKELNKTFEMYNDFMKKIKSYDSLLVTLENLKDKTKKIEDIEKIIDRKSGKIESIFEEFQGKLDVLAKFEDKIVSYDEILKDLMKDVDHLSTKSKMSMTKEEFANKIESFISDLDSMKSVVFDYDKKKNSNIVIDENKANEIKSNKKLNVKNKK